MKVRLSSSGSCVPPDSGGDPHPLDLQASLLEDVQAARELQAYGEGNGAVGPHGPAADLHLPSVPQEKEELIEEWQPEPLVAPLLSQHQPSVKYDLVTG